MEAPTTSEHAPTFYELLGRMVAPVIAAAIAQYEGPRARVRICRGSTCWHTSQEDSPWCRRCEPRRDRERRP